MERIRELLGRLTDLTPEELEELRGLVIAQADEVEGADTTPETVALLNELADAGEKVMAESSSREQAQAQAEADAQAARDRLNAVRGGDGEEGAEGESEEGAAGTEGESEEGAEAPEGAAVTAGGGVRQMAGRQPSPSPSPEAGGALINQGVLTATGHLRGVDGEVTGRAELGRAMSDTLRRMPREGAGRGDVLLASATWTYPEDRRLNGDPDHDAEVMDAVTNPQALVATGGICAPTNVDYTVPTWATAERPLRDGLPSFQADRGGLRYVTPPDIGALAGATGIWTSAVDANPGAATKPVIQVACGTEVQVLVDAISTRLGFGNMQSRFAPEQVAANTDLAVAAAARIAENNLLAKIQAVCTLGVTAATTLGASRDLLTTIRQALAAYRWLHRIADTQKFTAIFPAWLKDMFKVDLLREIGHAQTSEWNVLEISDAQVDELLRTHGVNPIWHLDGQAGATVSGVTFPLQGYAAQGAGSAVLSFPAKTVWYLFPEGTIQFLDGGRLDLGVVRDSTLDATNDYETFVETFENIAFRGFSSGGALQLVSTLCAQGGTTGTVTAACV